MPRSKKAKTRTKTRKLSIREMVGLGALATIAIGYIYIQYLILPQRDNLNKVQSEIDTIQVDVERVKNYKSLNGELEEHLMEEGSELDEAFARHFTKLNQEDVIMLLNEKINSTGIESAGLNFDRPTIEEVADEELERSSLEVSFRGGYQTLSSFLDTIEEYEKKIIVDRINMSREEGGSLTGTLFMNMYSIESIVEDAMTLFPWDQDADHIAVNPFNPFASYIQQEIIGDDDFSFSDMDGDDDRRDDDTTSWTTTPGMRPDDTTTGTTSPGTSTSGTTSSGGTPSASTRPGTTTPGTSKPSGTTSGTGTSKPATTPKPGETTPGTTKPGTTPSEPVERGTLIEGFEDKSRFFAVGSPRDDVRVSIDSSKDKSSGNYSLNLKYNFLKERRVSTASVGFVNDLIISEEVSKFNLDVRPLSRSQHKLGIVIRDSRGKLQDITISEDLGWSDWKSLEVDMPEGMMYPVRVQRFYVESRDFDKILVGDVLIDSFKGVK